MRLDPPPLKVLAAPVLDGARYRDRPVYFSDVIVARDSSARSFAQLRGASWAYNDSNSHSAYSAVLYRLMTRGETTSLKDHRSRISSAFDPSGRGWGVGASTIDSQAFAVELREHPGLGARLPMIESLGPSPIQAVVVARRLSPSLRGELATALTSMHRDREARQALAYGFVKRLVPVTCGDHDSIRRVLEAVERAGISFA